MTRGNPIYQGCPDGSSAILWVFGFVAFLSLYPVQSVLPLLMLEFHAGAVQNGAAVGATMLAVAILSPFVGMVSDAVGRKGCCFARCSRSR
jgi:YNFM family putative membrane transporter